MPCPEMDGAIFSSKTPQSWISFFHLLLADKAAAKNQAALRFDCGGRLFILRQVEGQTSKTTIWSRATTVSLWPAFYSPMGRDQRVRIWRAWGSSSNQSMNVEKSIAISVNEKYKPSNVSPIVLLGRRIIKRLMILKP